jgi:hypothetical protein
MIPKSGYRFSEKIMLKEVGRDDDSKISHHALRSRCTTNEKTMTSTSADRFERVRTLLFASTIAIAAQGWLSGVNGLSPADDPVSPYYLGEIAPPSWQGRPLAIPRLGGLGE